LADWSYILLKPAQRYLKRMPDEEQRRVLTALDELVANSALLDIKALKGRSELRLRVGRYRVLFIEDRSHQMYVVTTIGSRGDVYK
jgi:mRNA interferase RelE/StbE